MGWGEQHDFPSEIFLSHGTARRRTGIFKCFTDFGYGTKPYVRGLSHVCLSNIFCLTVPKFLAGEPFGVSENIRYRRKLWIRKLGWVEYHELPSEVFFPTVPKKIVQESFSVSFNFGRRIFLCIRGICHDSFPEIFCLTVPKKFIGYPSVFQKISGIEKFFGYDGRLEYLDFPSELFCLTVPKKIVQESFSVSFDFGHRNNLCTRGLCHDIFREILCLSVEKKCTGIFKSFTDFD